MSHKGHDNSNCGVNLHPCHTLSYTLEQRAKDGDVIQINGQDGIPYPMKTQHRVLRNITLIGTEGRASIAGEFSGVCSYLFADIARGLNMSPEQVSINLVNLRLIKIGITKLKTTLTTLNVQVVNCTVLKLSKSPIVDSSAAKTTVIFKKSIIRQVSKGLQVKSREFSLSIESSKIDNSGGSYPGKDCPQFTVIDDFESLVAHFSKSSFKYTFLIDLAASRQKKSNVSIIDSIFDDDSKTVKHNGCFSGMTLRNTTALIVNSNFTNIITRKSLIKAIASFVTFKGCIFSNISSKLGMFSHFASTTASFNKTNAMNNKLNGFNYGSVYLQSTEGIFQNCIFQNNTVHGQYGSGGAINAEDSSHLQIQNCFFKENIATYCGGAITMVKTRGSFVNCTLKRNSVKSRPQEDGFGGAICADNSNLTMHQCIFKENTATYSGGATQIQKSQSLFENCTFERNKVNSLQQNTKGGAISVVGTGTNISIKQCLFKENTATYGGGAIIMVKTRGSFVNCTLERNSVKSRPQEHGFGGAICAQDSSHLTLHQCIFKENTATYCGGATYIKKSQSLFESCIFERNKVNSIQQNTRGGAIRASGAGTNITIKQCLFKENAANYNGGAIDIEFSQSLLLKNSTFVRNTVKTLTGKGSGGGIVLISTSDITVQQCLFKENTAIYGGGVILMQESQGSFENCTFERNSVKSSLQKYDFGGAICALGNSHLTMHQCIFKENTATYCGGATYIKKSQSLFESCIFERNKVNSIQQNTRGGAIRASGAGTNITIKQCLFKENAANYNGGAIDIEFSQSLLLKNSTFVRNTVKTLTGKGSGGGIVLISTSDITVQQCLFKENTAIYGGGVILMQESQGSFENCTFERNSVKSSLQKYDFGGAICALGNSHLTMHQCIFKENTATFVGGAIAIQVSQSLIESCIFERNKVNSIQQYTRGGAIRAFGAGTNITIKQCLFKENAVNYNGGAINIEFSQSLLLKNSTFVRNTVNTLKGNGSAGGAIASIRTSDITVQQCLFKENTANDGGGAIRIQESRGSFENCTFERNYVKSSLQRYDFGGAICAQDNSHLTMHQCIFKENTATFVGGAIAIQMSQSLIESCIFERNKVNSIQQNTHGGAIRAFGAGTNITIKQCLFKENAATYSGGAIDIEFFQSLLLRNSTFVRNTVNTLKGHGSVGGAICSVRNSDITVQQCLFKENTATDGGGAIDIEDSGSLLFKSSTFVRNTVKNLTGYATGGAMNLLTNSDLIVQQCLFKENTATYSGGAILMQDSRGSFENCTFVGNAVQDLEGMTFGGAITSTNGSSYVMKHCIFKKNTATFYGGACHIQRSHSSFENCTFEGKV